MKQLLLLPFLFFTALSFGQVPNYIPTNGLVGYWPFNGNANDESGNGNNGTVNGATLTEDRFVNSNKAYSFTSSANCQNITIPNSTQLNPSNITINCWINALDSNMTIIEKSDPTNATKLSYAITFKDEFQGWKGLKASYGVNCAFSATNPAYWSPQNTYPNYSWIMVTVTINSNGDIKQYLNSSLVYSASGTQAFSPCNDPLSTLRIGGAHWNNDPECFKGSIDDIGIWNRVLSESEIKAIYSENVCTDTIQVMVYDTTYIAVNDTITHNDTNFVTISDTIIYYDSVSVAVTDTLIINTLISGLNSPNNINTLKVYPNPANDVVIIDNGDFSLMSAYKLKIVNSLGAEVFNSFVSIPQFQIPVSSIGGNGLYYIQIFDESSSLLTTKKLILK